VSAATDTATALMTFVGGPALIGIAAMTKFSGDVLRDDSRAPRQGWLALGAELMVAVWMVIFLILAAPTVYESWTTDGRLEPTLVLLSATAAASVGVLGFATSRVAPTVRLIDESYRADASGTSIKLIRRWTRRM
jgi:hypothetical protein